MTRTDLEQLYDLGKELELWERELSELKLQYPIHSPILSSVKSEENTADIIAYMESQRNDVCAVLGICLAALKNPDKYAKSTPREIATTMAILIDKYTAHSGDNIADTQSDDALSKSLRELGEGLESDGD